MEGAIDGNGTFTGITEINAGTAENPIYIDTPNIGFIMQVGGDDKAIPSRSATRQYLYRRDDDSSPAALVIAGD